MKKAKLLFSALFLALTLTFTSVQPVLAEGEGPQGAAKSSPARPEAPAPTLADLPWLFSILIRYML